MLGEQAGVNHQLIPLCLELVQLQAHQLGGVEVVGRLSSAPGAARHFCLRQVNPTLTCSSALLVCKPQGSPHPLALHMLLCTTLGTSTHCFLQHGAALWLGAALLSMSHTACG